MNKKSLMLTTLLAVAMMATPLVSTVQARITEEHHYGPTGEGFTEYYGTMGGANFYVLIPDDWTNPLGDGMLFVICRSTLYVEDPRQSIEDYPFAQALASQGIAVAASNYGTTIQSTKEGVIRTHQLTEFVIDNFGVTGKVFLCGTSLGGAVSLILGEKHPDIYSGVLDISGVKDWAMMYNTAANYQGSDLFLTVLYVIAKAGYEARARFGGTPDERPQKYAKTSPTSYTDLSIPVISLIHALDVIVEPEQTYKYHSLVGDTWHVVVEIYENTPGALPPIPGFPPPTSWYGHFDPLTWVARAFYFQYLVSWSNGDIGPGDIPPVFTPPP
jgi:hypothetical protein